MREKRYNISVGGEAPSATYSFYHSNIKPKPKAAEPAEGGKTVEND